MLIFNKNFYAETSLDALESQGWSFDDLYENMAEAQGITFQSASDAAKKFNVALRSNEDGDIFYSFIDDENNESHPSLSGDETKSREDLKSLYEAELLWNVNSQE